MHKKKLKPTFKFQTFSTKQKQILTWWLPESPVKDKDGIIADGAIRSGKTVSMALSFVMWAMYTFNGQNFAMCGKTIGSFKRNVWIWLKVMLPFRGYKVKKFPELGDNCYIITKGEISNYFFMFGGKDERSQDLIQGITLAGIFFDEVALMPESFVSQGTGRCSVTGSKFWFNCNPDSPFHWFNVEYVLKAAQKNLIHLHFVMDDNLSLAEETKARYKRIYQGLFYKRFILGRWVMASGAIYDMFTDDNVYKEHERPEGLETYCRRSIAVDYGTTNPCVFLDIYDDGTTLWIDREYYWDSKGEMQQKTDKQYADDLEKFIADIPNYHPSEIIVDPSAASFKLELRQRGLRVIEADNEVIDGIRMVASMVGRRLIKIHERCEHTKGEMTSYVWDEKAAKRGEEAPLKEKDHSCDALRYYVKTRIKAWRLSA